MKKTWVGLEGSGKSLALAIEIETVLERNIKWYKHTGIPREIWSNMPFSADFLERASENNIPIVYWAHLDEIVKMSGGDLIMDEQGTYFDSRNYAELSLQVRRWFAQADKNGVDIYGTAQDWAQVDISYRRLVNQVMHCRKMAGSLRPHKTKPLPTIFGIPLQKYLPVWGIVLVREISGAPDDTANFQFSNWFIFDLIDTIFIRKCYCDLYNTGATITQSRGVPLQHNERKCPECDFVRVFHK